MKCTGRITKKNVGIALIKKKKGDYYNHYSGRPIMKNVCNKTNQIDYSLFPFWVKWIDKIMEFFGLD